jgi:lipoprotein-anchoring transpeptidase ErfK/SrfK
VAIGVGLAAGLLGGAAASGFLHRDSASGIPSDRRLAAAAAALEATTKQHTPSTLAAQARARTIALYRHPGGASYRRLGPLEDSSGTHPVFRVLAQRVGWLHVSLPIRPNHSSAWIRTSDATVATTRYRIQVKERTHRLVLWRGRTRLLRAPIAVGKAVTPTPRGIYFLAFALHNTDPSGFYGPYSFGLSAYSNVFTTFAGGDGEIGLHGTSEPSLLGHSVSHGCVRVSNAVITRLAHLLPLGTPVSIER